MAQEDGGSSEDGKWEREREREEFGEIGNAKP